MTRWLVLALLCSTTIAHADADDALYTCKEPAATAQISAQFQPNTTIQDLVIWVMGFSCKNVVIASDARHATVTVVAPKKLTPKQAMQLFVDSVEATGHVVTIKTDTIVIKLGPNMTKNCPGVAQAPVAPVPDAGELPPPHSERVSKALAAGVRRIDDFNYELTRATARVLLDDETVLKGTRAVPAMKDGKPHAIKLFAIRPASAFAKLGFQNGDTVISVHGTQVVGLESFAPLLKSLKTALVDLKSPLAQVNVTVVRRGQTATLIYKIK
jgi:hypothetical protein